MPTTISQQLTHANENVRDGWTSAASTWTYASASTITVPSGAASIYQKGDRIKWTQTTVKYGVIVAVADTLLTIAVNTDYTVANAAITLNYYSHQANPLGYPGSFTYTVNATSGWTTTVSCTYRYSIFGNTCYLHNAEDFCAGGTSNTTSVVVPLPCAVIASTAYSGVSGWGRDNGANIATPLFCDLASSAMTFWKSFYQTAFTTSGQKVVFSVWGSFKF